jgi:hypothetical protein
MNANIVALVVAIVGVLGTLTGAVLTQRSALRAQKETMCAAG